jgi:hypothetical protein
MVAVALEQAVDQAGAAAAAGGFDHEDSNLSRQSVQLDAEGYSELSAAVGRLHAELASIQERSAARLKDAGEEAALQAGLVTMLFHAAPGDSGGGAAAKPDEAPKPKRKRSSAR